MQNEAVFSHTCFFFTNIQISFKKTHKVGSVISYQHSILFNLSNMVCYESLYWYYWYYYVLQIHICYRFDLSCRSFSVNQSNLNLNGNPSCRLFCSCIYHFSKIHFACLKSNLSLTKLRISSLICSKFSDIIQWSVIAISMIRIYTITMTKWWNIRIENIEADPKRVIVINTQSTISSFESSILFVKNGRCL